MDFQLTDRQKRIRMAAKEFAEGEFKEIARDCDVKEECPRELIKKAAELGFIGVLYQKGIWRYRVRVFWSMQSSWKNSGGLTRGLGRSSVPSLSERRSYSCLALKSRRRSICLL